MIVPSSSCTVAFTVGGTGGEIDTTSNVSFGYYEITMQTSQASGVVNSLFLYLSDANEIDIEVLTKQNTSIGYVNFSVHLPNQRTVTSLVALPFAPWAAFHRYGFDWQPDGVTWYVDGQSVELGEAQAVMINGQSYTLGGCTTTVTIGTGKNAQQQVVANPACFAGVQNVPQLPGLLIVNNWSDGNAWSGPVPTRDALLVVRNVMLAPNQ